MANAVAGCGILSYRELIFRMFSSPRHSNAGLPGLSTDRGQVKIDRGY
jgi:hypothetical protein